MLKHLEPYWAQNRNSESLFLLLLSSSLDVFRQCLWQAVDRSDTTVAADAQNPALVAPVGRRVCDGQVAPLLIATSGLPVRCVMYCFLACSFPWINHGAPSAVACSTLERRWRGLYLQSCLCHRRCARLCGWVLGLLVLSPPPLLG